MIETDDLPGLLRKTGELHGHHCVGSALGVIAAHKAVKELGVEEATGMEHVLAIVETNNCFSDGVQVVTGCTFGNNALIYRDYGKTAFTLLKRSGEGIRIVVRPEAMELLKNKDPEAEELYRKVVVDRNATHEEENRMIQLNKTHCYNILSIPAEKIFKIDRVKMESPVDYSKILESRFCEKCGEKVMATKTTVKEGKVLCISCASVPYNQLDWSGIVKIDPSNTCEEG
ncbi:TraR/DksA C4-type zinc finger protein [Candidatus Bathyarchaeota archaeon]|nr:TraR/DksA C4-type zinc finger protein [Candidatus Bathyarchaeota archaeon]